MKAGEYYVADRKVVIEEGDDPKKFKHLFKMYPQLAKACGHDTEKRKNKSDSKPSKGSE